MENKFRFFDKFNEVMVVSDKLGPFFSAYQETVDGGNNPELMQFTGLKDNNCFKIFDGDILRTCNGTIYPVSFGEFEFYADDLASETETAIGFYFDHGNSNASEPFGPWTGNVGYEVLGNIHQNPELLKGGDR